MVLRPSITTSPERTRALMKSKKDTVVLLEKRITLMFEGDENYIMDMITDAEINGIMVWEVK